MRTLCLALLLSGSGMSVAAADLARLTPESMWALQRVGPPAVAPDGRHVVAPVTRYDVKEDKGYTDLWWYATDGSEQRQLTTDAAAESNPLFSPDGRWIAFLAQRGSDTAAQLYVLPVSGGEALRLTNLPTGVVAPKWYGDSRRLAFISRVWPDLSWAQMGERLKSRAESKMTARVWDDAPITYWDSWIDDRQAQLYAVSIDAAEPEALTAKTGLQLPRSLADAASFDINKVTGQVAFVADSDAATQRVNLDVYLLEADAKATNLSPDNAASDNAPSWSPDGRLLAFARQTVAGFYGDTRRLMIYDAKAKPALRAPHPDWDRSADGLVWRADSRALYGAIDDAGSVNLYELPLQGQPQQLSRGANIGSLAAAAKTGAPLLGLRESFVEPPTLVRINPRSGASDPISHHNDAAMAALQQGRYESVSYPGANQDPVQMWITYPPDFDPARRWPIVLLLHGGPHNGITNAWSWRWNAQAFAARGYVAVWHNFHGSSGFGQAYADSINPKQDALPYEDTIKAADWLAAQPWADGERMVAAGGSYGGYLATILLGRPHPFKALVAHAAVYNWYTQVGSDFGFTEPRFPDYTDDPQTFLQASPHFGAGHFKTPTLVIHGQQDFRVPVNHGIELYHMLKRRGVPSRLIYYPNENHWVLKPQNSIFWYQQVFEWIERYAKPGPTES